MMAIRVLLIGTAFSLVGHSAHGSMACADLMKIHLTEQGFGCRTTPELPVFAHAKEACQN